VLQYQVCRSVVSDTMLDKENNAPESRQSLLSTIQRTSSSRYKITTATLVDQWLADESVAATLIWKTGVFDQSNQS
jgi:hypothetical protein